MGLSSSERSSFKSWVISASVYFCRQMRCMITLWCCPPVASSSASRPSIIRLQTFVRFSSESIRAVQELAAKYRYTVITSASADEDSYRRSFTSGNDESSTAAIMARSLCEGAGWDIIYDRSVSLKADADRDRKVTVREIFEYARRRVAHYLEGTSVTQTVYLFSDGGGDTVLFGKAPQ